MDASRKGFTTYLLGAGASANAIPVVNMMDYRLQKFMLILKLFQEQTLTRLEYNHPKYDFRNYLDFITQLKLIIDNVIEHYSFDTYAKKLFLTKNKSYDQLKLLINAYILFEQVGINKISTELEINNAQIEQHRIKTLTPEVNKYLHHVGNTNIDSRYDVLLASILNNDIIWPDEIKIISYNYDNQIEIAYDFYKDFHSANKDLKIFDLGFINTPNIVKLNGYSSFYSGDAFGELIKSATDSYRKFENFSILRILHNLYNSFISHPNANVNTHIHFAWENDDYSIAALDSSVNIMRDTSNLVIIGYSFPEFNRVSDEKILANLPDNCVVHIQTTKDTFETICSRFKQRAKNEYKINEVLFIDQFFIP